jgi:hypothetical protein
MTHEWTRAEYTISTDPRRLDVEKVDPDADRA